ncbi:MAG: hypothetical protein V3U18_04585 [Alphaproteobacteria bacterium]
MGEAGRPKRCSSDLAAQVRRLHPGIKLACMTGHADKAANPCTVLDEEVRIVKKPFSKPDLVQAVREALDARPSEA